MAGGKAPAAKIALIERQQTALSLRKSGASYRAIAAHIAAHESPRTTKLYDRTADKITQEEIERIRF